jgi:phosphoglucomutase
MTQLEPQVNDRLNSWLAGPYDQDTKQALIDLLDRGALEELTDSFYRDLEFGTGGLRGIMGPGSNRVNKYTLGMATQGLSNYLLKTYPNEPISVAIAHDSRNNSSLFAKMTADVFSANGIKVYFFEGMRPTPELSYAIRLLGCKSGVMLTASHNPKEYNGYKAYGDDGGQLVSPHDKNVIEEVRNIKSISDVKFDRIDSNVVVIGKEVDEKYLSELLKLTVNQGAIDRQKDLKIVFSPIHGTGATSVPPVLKAKGFENVIVVEDQMIPDGNFPTVIYPNPEEQEALTMALDKAKEVDADLVMATDPDADRVGIAVKNDEGSFILLNGNQTAALLVEYMLEAWEKAGKLTGDQYIVKTIVTSYLLDKIATAKNVECFNTLTGFKFIGAVMTALEGKKTFIVGGEESYGYLVGEHARDKDAVVSCAMIAEMTAFYKDQGSSLYQALIDLHIKYGLYEEKLISITKKGKSGAEEIKDMMSAYRRNPPKSLGGSTVASIKDYQNQVEIHLADGRKTTIDLPKSDVLQFITADGCIISARPSGTEPKIKFYCSVNAPVSSKSEYNSVLEGLRNKIDLIMDDLQR